MGLEHSNFTGLELDYRLWEVDTARLPWVAAREACTKWVASLNSCRISNTDRDGRPGHRAKVKEVDNGITDSNNRPRTGLKLEALSKMVKRRARMSERETVLLGES